jgi:Fe-Mn family superoxide dismutase
MYTKTMFTEQQFPIPNLTGISHKTIEEHLKLYAGYVKNANTIIEKMATIDSASDPYIAGELFRRFSFEFNGMRNHEIYFSLLSGQANATAPKLIEAIETQWGSLESWQNAFATLALTRGIGWAMLSLDTQTNSLIMHWVDEQHLGQLQGTKALIALDMWEHSYVADYQPSGKKQYIADFLAQLNWSFAEALYSTAKNIH